MVEKVYPGNPVKEDFVPLIDRMKPGALTGLPFDKVGEEEEDDTAQKLYRFDVFQNQPQQAPDTGGRRLQDVYGTGALPMYEWVRRIKTGERVFDPSSQFDNSMLEQYRNNMAQSGEVETNPTMMGLLKSVAPDVGGMVGSAAGRALADPMLSGDYLMRGAKSLAPDFVSTLDLPSSVGADVTADFISKGGSQQLQSGQSFLGAVGTEDAAKAAGFGSEFRTLSADNALVDVPGMGKGEAFKAIAPGREAEVARVLSAGETSDIASFGKANIATQGETGITQFGQELFSKPNVAAAGANFAISFGLDLIMGKDPVEAAKSSAASAVGATIGGTVGGPIGAFIGGTLGRIIGGRVICNELHRQGLMAREHVLLDYRFTRDYLTPQHVNGYHIWSIWMVRHMRKGRFVKFWSHVAGHRAKEIAYIYGKQNKPDYLGKIYRKIFEPTCWLLGCFSRAADWSVLYKAKEI
jgi:hypothetical protein